jgi:hypothetical protein
MIPQDNETFIGTNYSISLYHNAVECNIWSRVSLFFKRISTSLFTFVQAVLFIKIWIIFMNIIWNTIKSGGTKNHFRWVKVPGTAPYWKACMIAFYFLLFFSIFSLQPSLNFGPQDLGNNWQSDSIIGSGDHLESSIQFKKNIIYVKNHPMTIPAKIDSNWPSSFQEVWSLKVYVATSRCQ